MTCAITMISGMELDDFWALMRTVGPEPADEDLARLTDLLATRSPQDITGFEDRLAEVLFALDTPAHAEAADARGDWFLYVCCGTVAAGRDAYEAVLADPAALRRFASREAEPLLSVARDAYERRTGMLWEHVTPVDAESGSNTAAWGYEPDPGPPEEEVVPQPWLSLFASVFHQDGWPAAYEPIVHHLGQAVAADDAWTAWWSAAGIPECQLSLVQHDIGELGPAGITVKVGRVRVEGTAVSAPAPVTGTEPEDLLPLVVADVTALFEAVRARLHLAPLPPLPVPDLPADLPRGIERPITVPGVVAQPVRAGLSRLVPAGLLGRLHRG